MAASGDADAHRLLHARALEMAGKHSMHDWLGAEELIELDGMAGVLDLAKVYGQRLQRDPTDVIDDICHFVNDAWQAEIDKTLSQQAEQDADVRAYWDFLQQSRLLKDEYRHRSQSHMLTFERILSDARNAVGQIPGHYTAFGRKATKEELEQVYNNLLSETDEAVKLRLLWVFRRIPMPNLDDRLIEWATGDDEPFREAAIAALAQLSDKRVHKLARLKMQNRELLGADSEAIDLFIYNYDSPDAGLIFQALLSVEPTVDEAHTLGYSITKLAEQNNDPRLGDSLKWVYENTPCTVCRYDAVLQLHGREQLSPSLIQECLFDASEEIRDFMETK